MDKITRGIQVYSAGFDVAVTPTVTSGAYSAGDIMGALMTFTIAPVGSLVTLQHFTVNIKAAVSPNITAHIFTSDPSSTTKTDNAAYSLNAADIFKRNLSLALGASYTDHGTPNSLDYGAIAKPIQLAADSGALYVLLVDGTGVTLTSTSDVQCRMAGFIG
jgi:hypothetical protein